MRLTIRELDRLQSVDIGAVDPAMLPDAGSVALNAALPQRDRVSCLVQAGINPYCFCVGGVGVKIEFSEDGPSLQDTLARGGTFKGIVVVPPEQRYNIGVM